MRDSEEIQGENPNNFSCGISSSESDFGSPVPILKKENIQKGAGSLFAAREAYAKLIPSLSPTNDFAYGVRKLRSKK